MEVSKNGRRKVQARTGRKKKLKKEERLQDVMGKRGRKERSKKSAYGINRRKD